MKGKVYFISAPGRIKVGYTTQPERRLATLRHVDMEELSMIAAVNGSRKTEKAIHNLLARHRLRGEWFTDCADVRAIIARAVDGEFAPEPEFDATETATAGDLGAVLAQPGLMKACVALLDDLGTAIDRGADKYEIRGRSRALITITEQMLGVSLVKREPEIIG